MFLKACLNGARLQDQHPALPISPAQLAAGAASAQALGVSAIHVHVKDADGADTFGSAELADVLKAVHASAPGLPIGVTTGAWALPDPADRAAAVRSWSTLPAFASVNWHEDGADQVAEALLDRGVHVEAGLWNIEAISSWSKSRFRDRCLRVLIELPDGLDADETASEARSLLGAMRVAAGRRIPTLVHGEGSSCWPAVRYARRQGLATRIGLEDTLELPDGAIAPDNDSLIKAALQILHPG